MNKYILILLISLAPYLLRAQEEFNLKHCIEIGLEKNYDIRITRNNQKISDNNKTLANAGYLPELDLNAGYSGTLNNTKQHLTTGETNKNNGIHNQQLNAGLNFNMMLFDGFSIKTRYNRLSELQKMGEINTRLTIENFIARVSTEYYNHIQQKLRLNNLLHTLDLSRERLRIIEARYQIGSSSRLDYQQAKVDFNSDSSKLIKQYEILYRSNITLNELLALEDVDKEINTADSIIEFNPLLLKDSIWEKAQIFNPILQLSHQNKYLSELELKSLKSQNYPYLRLNMGYGFTRNMYDIGSYTWQNNLGFNYGVTLGFKIFDGNRRREQHNARIAIDSRQLELEQLVLSLKTDLADIWKAYVNNMDLANLERENLETAKSNYEIAIDRYKLGDLSGIELREAQNSLYEAEERLVQSQYNTKLCEISLVQISGEIVFYME